MKRVICAILSVLMLVSMVSIGAMNVSATSALTTSDAAVEILKQFEGFKANAYPDNGQYSIGYGTSCDPEDYPNGITEEEATVLLKEALAKCEETTNGIANKHGLTFTQGQFDALVLFAYNLGYGWYVGNENGSLYQAIVNGATGNDFIYAMTLWCKASGAVHTGLVNRRLAEANLYLNGTYSKNPPANYSYVIFDGNGGAASVAVQGYDASGSVAIKATAEKSGYYFAGWYTAEEGGSKVTVLDGTTKAKTLYAHWQKNEPIATGVVTASSLYIRDKANASGKIVGGLSQGSKVEIYEIVTVGTAKWGLIDSGWICLTYVKLDEDGTENPGTPETPEDPDQVIATGEITASALFIRKGPGSGYDSVGYYAKGDKVEILETRLVGTTTWGRTNKGWISMSFVKLDAPEETEPEETEPEETEPEETEPQETEPEETEPEETEPEETEPQETEPQETEPEETEPQETEPQETEPAETEPAETEPQETEPEETEPQETEPAETEPAETEPAETEPQETEPEETEPEEDAIASGTVTGTVYLRKAAGANGEIIGSVPYGEDVDILGLQVKDGIVWAKIKGGWISLNYVKLKTPFGGTVDCALNVRAGAGTGFKCVGSYGAGDKVKIYETKTVNGAPWGRTDKGWINLKYVTLDDLSSETTNPETPGTPGTPDSAVATGTVTASGALTIRRGPGLGYGVAGYYSKGDKVEILETALSGSTTWGRTDKGWISLAYVQLDAPIAPPSSGTETPGSGTETPGSGTETPGSGTETPGSGTETPVTPPAGNTLATGTITASSLSVRSGAGAKFPVLRTVSYGTAVEIYELIAADGVLWARTQYGWLSTNYVKLNAPVGAEVTASGLNIRSKAGLNGANVGMYLSGDKVSIYETKTVNGAPWGRTDKGWINLKYVKFGVAAGSVVTPGTGTETPGTGTETPGSGTENPGTETPVTPPAETVIVVGVIEANSLSVRSGGSAYSGIVTTVSGGTVVEIYELKVADGILWGRINGGWISMNYVKMNLPLTGKITATNLTIRSQAGFTGTAIDYYSSGEQVLIYETATANGLAWGLTNKGWISLKYVEFI